VFGCGRTHRGVLALAAVGLACVLASAPSPLRSQSLNDAETGFEQRFAMEGWVVPIFTRPEVTELLSSLGPWPASVEEVASAEMHEPDRPEPPASITIAEPKGPAKVLKDLLNTPVKELLVSRAEAGPDVPPPPEAQTNAPSPTETASVPVRAADPVAERPPADVVASAPGPIALQAEPRPEVGSQPEQAPAPPAPAQTIAAAEPIPDQRSASPEPPARSGPAAQGRLIGAGRAAWYEHPGRTASGETFDPNRLTAAHHTLPFGTQVRVVNAETGRSVVVRINDRIPRKTKILIDLSRAGGKAIGLAGTGRVSLYRLGPATSMAAVDPPKVQAPPQRKMAKPQAVQRRVVQERGLSTERRRAHAASAKQAKRPALRARIAAKQAKPSPYARLAARAGRPTTAALSAKSRHVRYPAVQDSQVDVQTEPTETIRTRN
jgi:rare lipoprotein A